MEIGGNVSVNFRMLKLHITFAIDTGYVGIIFSNLTNVELF